LLRAVASVFILSAFWIVLSGFFTPFLLGAGIGSAIAVSWLLHRMRVADNGSASCPF
jgi:multicomponent Na+:H+ antiporter subunit E